MTAWILHLLSKTTSCTMKKVPSQSKNTAEYEIDNRSVFRIFVQIYKDTDLYAYIKQHESKRDGRGAFYAIYSRCQGPNHINVTTSEAEVVLQMLTYSGEKKAWNEEKYHA